MPAGGGQGKGGTPAEGGRGAWVQHRLRGRGIRERPHKTEEFSWNSTRSASQSGGGLGVEVKDDGGQRRSRSPSGAVGRGGVSLPELSMYYAYQSIKPHLS